MSGVDCCSAQDDGEHGFADSEGSDEQHVGRVGEISTCDEFSDKGFVDAGLSGEVEVVELGGRREVREPHPAVPASLLGGFDLDP